MDFGIYLTRIEKELDLSLPKRANRIWAKESFGPLLDGLDESHMQPLLEPTRSLVDLGGKRWRPLLLVLCAESMAIRSNQDADSVKENAFHLAPLVEFIHTASLIHDDIEDSSETRRGQPAAYKTYGLDAALNAASWLYFQAATCIDRTSATTELKNMLLKLYTTEARKLHLGQAMDISWHNKKSFFPTRGEYLAMVQCKTGTLSSLAAKTGTLVAGAGIDDVEKAGRAAAKIGAGFQIIDDVINLKTGNPGKNRGDDIVEGKKSLPVLLFIEDAGTDSVPAKKLVDCFEQAGAEGISSPSVEAAIKLLEGSGAVDRAAKMGSDFIEDGCADFEKIFGTGNPGAIKIRELFMAMVPKNCSGENNHA